MKDFKSKAKIKLVNIKPFFHFEFKHIPTNEEIKEKIQELIDIKNVSYEISVSYHKEYKGKFWDDKTKKFYKWNDLMELHNEES